MKRLFTCSNAGELALLRSVLDASRISYEVRNEAVSQTFPGMAADPEIWVLEEKDYEEAERLIKTATNP